MQCCNGFSGLYRKSQRHKGANVQTCKISGTHHGMVMSSRMIKPCCFLHSVLAQEHTRAKHEQSAVKSPKIASERESNMSL